MMLARRHPLRPAATEPSDGDGTAENAVPSEHTQLVTAAQACDAMALEKLVAAHLPLLYRVVGRALNGHCDVDDVVQETLLRVVRDLPALREPASFRPWLVAIATRQVGTYRRRRRTTDQGRAIADVSEVADRAADFQNLTVLRLHLSDQHRQVVTAASWLDPEHRKLLTLWSQEAAGVLGRAELAARAGLSVPHAGVRLQRMHEQLQLCRVITAALAARPPCPHLTEAIAGWDGEHTSVWRKRIGRHVRGCPDCSRITADLVSVERLLLACRPRSLPVDAVDSPAIRFEDRLDGANVAKHPALSMVLGSCRARHGVRPPAEPWEPIRHRGHSSPEPATEHRAVA